MEIWLLVLVVVIVALDAGLAVLTHRELVRTKTLVNGHMSQLLIVTRTSASAEATLAEKRAETGRVAEHIDAAKQRERTSRSTDELEQRILDRDAVRKDIHNELKRIKGRRADDAHE